MIPGLGWSPEKEMAVHSSILAWEIPWTEESGGLRRIHGVTKESDMTWQLIYNCLERKKQKLVYSFQKSGVSPICTFIMNVL